MASPEVFTDAKGMRNFSRSQRRLGKTVAFVPTMGFLHEGHISLVRAAREHADVVIASIYVNPTQFAKGEDFDVYPRDVEGDRAKLAAAGCVAVFEPTTLYSDPPSSTSTSHVVGMSDHVAGSHETFVQVEHLQKPLCGGSRPHFFRGVATIVTKLFHIVEPDVAVFGKKDYQQWRVIRRMVRDLDFDIQVIGMPIGREADGLAMSSRNARLSEASRAKAVALSQALLAAQKGVKEGGGPSAAGELQQVIREAIAHSGGTVDYVEVVDCEDLLPVTDVREQPSLIAVAAHYPARDGSTVRLIDNIEIF